ncbi:MAG: hypothetical protein ACLFVI_05075 [Archaeoglobaceae archaeon]
MRRIALIMLLVWALLFAGCADDSEENYLVYKGKTYNISQGDIIHLHEDGAQRIEDNTQDLIVLAKGEGNYYKYSTPEGRVIMFDNTGNFTAIRPKINDGFVVLEKRNGIFIDYGVYTYGEQVLLQDGTYALNDKVDYVMLENGQRISIR